MGCQKPHLFGGIPSLVFRFPNTTENMLNYNINHNEIYISKSFILIFHIHSFLSNKSMDIESIKSTIFQSLFLQFIVLFLETLISSSFYCSYFQRSLFTLVR